MRLDNNQQAFFKLVRAGLWEKEARLSQFSDIDYAAILQLAEEQSVVGLITIGLEHVTDVKVPQEWALQFVGETLQIEQQNKAMNKYVANLFNLLRAEDVYAVLVKGQGIAQCYGKPLWRASGDIDLLLSDTNYEKAKKVLLPLAADVESEFKTLKHIGMTMQGGFVVELHGTLHSRLSNRIDKVIDEAQRDVFYGGNVRSWNNGNTTVFLPSLDNDVIFVFTHILQHYFIDGIGLKQICDLCFLLWVYRTDIDVMRLEHRLRKAGLMSEWLAFAALAVDWLGMPIEAMPLYSEDNRWSRKATKICSEILIIGNLEHKQRRDFSGMSYMWRKFVSFRGRFSDMLRHFTVFPMDSIIFFGGMLRSGLHAAVRGE